MSMTVHRASPAPSAFAAVSAVLGEYFDGLHYGDVDKLRQVFHPQAIYATASEGNLRLLTMAEYLPIVAARPSPASRNEARTDRICSIEFAGPVTALAQVECAIRPKHFIDFLTLVRVDARWQIVAKAFHFDLETEV